MKIICAESVLHAEEVFSHLGEVTVLPDGEIDHLALKKAEALIIRSGTSVTASLIANTPLSFVGTATAGFDHLDIWALAKQQIVWHTAKGCNGNSVAEYVIAVLLEFAFSQSFSLSQKTIGIVGKGWVGRAVGEKARGLGMNVLYNDPPLRDATGDETLLPLEALLQECHIITLHVPLTREGAYPTCHFFNGAHFEKMKSDALLINTSRGGVIQEEDLIAALDARPEKMAVLDVFANEPFISQPLLSRCVLGTPHIAGYSMDGRVEGTLSIYRKLCEFLSVKPKWSIEKLYPHAKHLLTIGPKSPDDSQDLLRKIIKNVYDVRQDHQRLLAGQLLPEDERGDYFRQLRKSYPIRWEFPHYHVKLLEKDPSLEKYLVALGFSIVTNNSS